MGGQGSWRTFSAGRWTISGASSTGSGRDFFCLLFQDGYSQAAQEPLRELVEGNPLFSLKQGDLEQFTASDRPLVTRLVRTDRAASIVDAQKNSTEGYCSIPRSLGRRETVPDINMQLPDPLRSLLPDHDIFALLPRRFCSFRLDFQSIPANFVSKISAGKDTLCR